MSERNTTGRPAPAHADGAVLCREAVHQQYVKQVIPYYILWQEIQGDFTQGDGCKIAILSRFVALSVSLIQKVSLFQTWTSSASRPSG